MPGRAIRSNFLQKVKAGLRQPKSCPYSCIHTCDVEKTPYCISVALYQAYKGNFEPWVCFCRFVCVESSSHYVGERDICRTGAGV